MDEEAGGYDREWSRETQKIAVLSWISFLTAAIATMFCFAFIDPIYVIEALNFDAIESRNAGYAIGFFYFWAIGWVAGWFTLRLVRRKRHGPGAVKR